MRAGTLVSRKIEPQMLERCVRVPSPALLVENVVWVADAAENVADVALFQRIWVVAGMRRSCWKLFQVQMEETPAAQIHRLPTLKLSGICTAVATGCVLQKMYHGEFALWTIYYFHKNRWWRKKKDSYEKKPGCRTLDL